MCVARCVAHQHADVSRHEAKDVHRVVDSVQVLGVHVPDRVRPGSERLPMVRQAADPGRISGDHPVQHLDAKRFIEA
eukprot:scaffold104210_cov75-Phaeocystis_antarctica.AAC.2